MGNLDIIRVKPSECLICIDAIFAGNRVPFIWGPPGIAKSSVVKQYATDRNMAFADVRLAQMESTDLRGIPFPIKENGINGVKWSPPLILPKDLDINQIIEIKYAEPFLFTFANSNPKGANGIHYIKNPEVKASLIEGSGEVVILSQTPTSVLVCISKNEQVTTGTIRLEITGQAEVIVALEEFNSAPPPVQTVSYELILDRRVGEYIVPDGVSIIAMGNRDTDKGVTFKMPSPAANRFGHLEMIHDYEEWEAWAINNGIHWTVIGFLSRFKEFLFQFDPTTASRGYPTPRSWHALSDILNARPNLSYNIMNAIVAGFVGDAVGNQYMEFRKLADKLPLPADILSGKLKTMPVLYDREDANKTRMDVNISFAMTTLLCGEVYLRFKKIEQRYGTIEKYAVSEEFKVWVKEADNFLGFIMANFKPDPCIMAARNAVRARGLPFIPKHMPNFVAFSEHYREFMTA